jgi:hypothetical protein
VRELEDEDAMTQEAVQWMASAWAQMEVPQSRKPVLQIRRFALPAAAALLLSALLFWNARYPAQEDLDPTGLIATAPGQTPAPSSPAPPDSPSAESAKPESPQLLANNAEHVQMRAGTVRLTMLRGNEAPRN